jgi:hypothetical protein
VLTLKLADLEIDLGSLHAPTQAPAQVDLSGAGSPAAVGQIVTVGGAGAQVDLD